MRLGRAIVEFPNPDQLEAAGAPVAPRAGRAEGAVRRVLGGGADSTGHSAPDATDGMIVGNGKGHTAPLTKGLRMGGWARRGKPACGAQRTERLTE